MVAAQRRLHRQVADRRARLPQLGRACPTTVMAGATTTKNVVVAPTMTNESLAGPTWQGRIGAIVLVRGGYCSRKPPRKRRNTPPSRESAGVGGGAFGRSVA